VRIPNIPIPAFSLKYKSGGAAACVTAGRLAAADPTLKILVGESLLPIRHFYKFKKL